MGVYGGPGADTFHVSSATGDLGAIAGSLGINGGGGYFDLLLVDDRLNQSSTTYTVNDNIFFSEVSPPGCRRSSSPTWMAWQGQRVLDFPLFYRNFCLY